jgi:V8-like Glu-specific endopeptidase
VFELDAIAYPGNSGSPVWHPDSVEVLGVVNSVLKGRRKLRSGAQRASAMPSVKYVHRLLEQALPKAP